MSPSELAARFGCSIEQLRSQYEKNAAQLRQMADKAKVSGRRVNKYTFAQLDEMATRYAALAENCR